VLTSNRALLLICLVIPGMLICTAARAESHRGESDLQDIPTNLGLLRTTIEEAIGEVCDRLSLHELTTLCLSSQPDSPDDWLVEQTLVEHLLGRGYRVIIPDSLPATPPEICPDAGILRYHILTMDLEYISTRRQRLFGPRMVERKVYLSMLFRLSLPTGEVVWAGETKKTAGDLIPFRDLPLAERESAPFLSPRLPPDNWGRLAEPALLTVAIGSLIYLFYSTQ
jgi:hypothetical protein